MTSEAFRRSIQAALQAAFPSPDPRVTTFYGMQHYQLGWRDEQLQPAQFDPGKLLRPYFVLLGCRVAGGNPEQALPLAAGIQLLHDFSLIHDDIEDDSDTRRGRPTVWKVWGLAQGINAGDGMFVVAHLALHQLPAAGVPAERALAILQRFDQTILTICEGQYLDLANERNLAISEADYLAMISRKTAALIAAACGLGSMVAGCDPDLTRALYDFGENLGLAFQIEDDVLGIWGDPASTGKPFAADLIRRKLSIPVIHALQHAPASSGLAEQYARPAGDARELQGLLDVLEATGSRSYTEHLAATYHQKALAALDRMQGDATAIAELRAIANSLVGRKH